jgi:glycine cleavage system H lipoate-binding protein
MADPGTHPKCPFLKGSLVQHCAAASVRQFIPYTDSLTCRCMSETFRYCSLFLNVSRPEPETLPGCWAEMAVPADLLYSANHFWLDLDDNRLCHIGIDAFLAGLLGQVERIQFLETQGTVRPSVVVTARGTDLHLVFPNRLLLTGINSYLRARPERIASDPYRQGWLFEGKAPLRRGAGELQVTAGLHRGAEAIPWMRDETVALARTLLDLARQSDAAEAVQMLDHFSLDALTREEFLQVALRFSGSNRFRRSLTRG